MWEKIKQSISSGNHSTNLIAGRDFNLYVNRNISTSLVDTKIGEEVKLLRKSRFFAEFDRNGSSLRLALRLAEDDLSGGSDEMRGSGLAWCARILSPSDDLEQVENFLELAKNLADSPEAKIAEAFVISQNGDKAAALQTLAGIDSHASRSAGLMIVAHHGGAEDALSWIDATGYRIKDLDSDGKYSLLIHQLQLGRWGDASQTVDALSEADFDETPILYHWAALATLAPTVPQDYRATFLSQVPFEVQGFPLASNSSAMDARRTAHKYFLDAVGAATRLECPRAARKDDEYALWLELVDPAQRAYGLSRLENKLNDPDIWLGFVHYALQFGIKLDLVAVEREIDIEIAKNGGMTLDTAIARFALAFTKPTAEEAAKYIARHQNQLATHIDPKLMQFRQVELYSRASMVDQANGVLDLLVKNGITAEEEKNLRMIILEAQGNNQVESRKIQYTETGVLDDLINLVAELEKHRYWEDLCQFGKLLYDKTFSLQDAERLVNALNNTYRTEELVTFLNENSDLLSQSEYLRMAYAWGLYYEGEFLKARVELAELIDKVDKANYRALKVNLAVAMGDWPSLIAYIADEYQNRNDRSAHDLIGAAQLALHLDSHHAKDLVFEAAAKAVDDPAVLTAAYLIATTAGWEYEPQVFLWLEKAAELSGEDGPLQRMSLRDILDQKPEWDRRESETWRLLARGQLPIFLAAQSLNRTLIGLTTFPALVNLGEIDPRRRTVIPAYSGNRVPLELNINGKCGALDATALLTLSFLKILDVALDAFETIYIPHSTLGWLFEERQKAAFHQPSRIASAHIVRDLLARDLLYKFTPITVASSDLSAQIGDDLAALITEAEKVRDDDNSQHIVVRSAPVHRLSSLMEEEADLSAHAAVLSSCIAVVEKLRQKGQITANEEKRARAYLQLHEKPWPRQPDIADGATLYLDDLAIRYLLHLRLLGKLKAAGLKAVLSPREPSETDALISYEGISEEVKAVIERVRASLTLRIGSGQVKVGRRCNFDKFEEKSIPEHPSVGILALAPHCDVAVIDDRFLNQHANIESGGARVPVFSTLDLLDSLVVAGVFSDDDCLEHRTRLRRAGYFFIPVSVEELGWCLRQSTVADGAVVETAELKAIRESVLRVRMSDWLRLPEEAPWLDGTLKTFANVLKNLWTDGDDLNKVILLSNWLLELYDIRGWAHVLVPENADNVVQIGNAAHYLLLLSPPTGVQQSVVDAYWDWVEEKILVPMQEQFPEAYEWLVDWYSSFIEEMAQNLLSGGNEL